MAGADGHDRVAGAPLAVLAFAGALGLAGWFARSDLRTTGSDAGPDEQVEPDAITEWSHLPRRTR